MNKSIIPYFIALALFSCTAKHSNELKIFKVKSSDYSCPHESFSGFVKLAAKNYSIRDEGIRKNEPLYLYIKHPACAPFTQVIENSDHELVMADKNCTLTKINDYKFKLILDSSYNKEEIVFNYYLWPKKGVRIVWLSTKDSVEYPDRTLNAEVHYPMSHRD